jgi:TonB family protein
MKAFAYRTIAFLCLLVPASWTHSQQAQGASAAQSEKGESAEVRNAVVLRSPLGRCFSYPPPYPQEALRNDQAGRTTLVFLVSPDGAVQDPAVLRGSGHEILDNAALAHLAACIAKFRTLNASPLPAGRYVLPFSWRIPD